MADKKLAHTPGPWYATKAKYWQGHLARGTLSARKGCWTVSTDPNAPGWNTDGGHSGYGIGEADARLMAAAPRLLEALEGMVAFAEASPFNPDPSQTLAVSEARAAIREATNG